MKEYMKDYINKIDEIIKKESVKDLDNIIEEHLIKIKFFMHERLIHLLVTILFALMTTMVFLYTLNNMSIGLFLLLLLFVLLLVPYIFHYYFLENSVQHMYKQYDLLKEKKNLHK